MREEPFITKCCHCIPLKFCLQTWACIKIVADIFASFFLTVFMLVFIDFNMELFPSLLIFFIIMLLLIVDSVFMILLSFGLRKNNVKIIGTFFYYSIAMVTMETIAFIILLFLIICFGAYGMLSCVLFPVTVIILCVDACIIVTARSEMIKLRNKQQFEFMKMDTNLADTEIHQELHIEGKNYVQ